MELRQIQENLIKGDAKEVARLVKEALKNEISPKEILENGLIAGMSVIGDRFKKNEIFIPEVLICARAMHSGMQILEPILVKSDIKPTGKFLIGTVKGDLHDIGKNLVIMMLKGAGFQVVDLGINVPVEKFIEAIEKEKPDVLGMSALLTTTMMEMKKNIEVFKKKGLNIKVIIGGAPVTAKFAKDIAADGYAPDAASAVDEVKKILSA